MLIPNLRTPPASAATAPVLTGAVQRWGTALLAASVLSSTPFTPPAFAATPTPTELSRIAEGLARIDYLLDNWDKLTTVCKGTPDELESKQTVKIVDGLGGTRCTKSLYLHNGRCTAGCPPTHNGWGAGAKDRVCVPVGAID